MKKTITMFTLVAALAVSSGAAVANPPKGAGNCISRDANTLGGGIIAAMARWFGGLGSIASYHGKC